MITSLNLKLWVKSSFFYHWKLFKIYKLVLKKNACYHILEGTTKSGIEDYEGMEMEVESGEGGPGPQRCKLAYTTSPNYNKQ